MIPQYRQDLAVSDQLN